MARKGGTPENLIPFKKGQSGNPKGRPKGVPTFSTLFKKYLGTIAKAGKHPLTNEDVKKLKLTAREIITLQLIAQAMNGNIKAIREVLDRVEGKVAQKNLNMNGEADDDKFRDEFFGFKSEDEED